MVCGVTENCMLTICAFVNTFDSHKNDYLRDLSAWEKYSISHK